MRQYLALEAQELGNVAWVARTAHVSVIPLSATAELEAGDLYTPGSRMRAQGAGPKRMMDTDGTLQKDFGSITGAKRGSDEPQCQWTCKSLSDWWPHSANVGTSHEEICAVRLPAFRRILAQSQ